MTKLTKDHIEELDRLDAFLDKVWRQTTRNERFHLTTLSEAFGKVQDPKNWKSPIRNVCRTVDKNKVAEAITFYTGSVAIFEDLSNGWTAVKAEGYYAAIGA